MQRVELRLIGMVPWAFSLASAWGCGSAVETAPGEVAGAATGSGGASVGSSVAASQASASSASSASTTSTSGQGGATTCAASSIDVDGDGPTQHLTSICNGSWGSDASTTPVAFIFQGGPVDSVPHLIIDGCASAAAGSVELRLSVPNVSGTGTFGDGDATYRDATGLEWTSPVPQLFVDLTSFGAVGSPVVGSFKGLVTMGGNAGKNLAGSFSACRVPDEDVP